MPIYQFKYENAQDFQTVLYSKISSYLTSSSHDDCRVNNAILQGIHTRGAALVPHEVAGAREDTCNAGRVTLYELLAVCVDWEVHLPCVHRLHGARVCPTDRSQPGYLRCYLLWGYRMLTHHNCHHCLTYVNIHILP